MQLEEVKVNGCPDQRYPGNTNISFAWIEGESLLMAMKKVAVSSVSYLPQLNSGGPLAFTVFARVCWEQL